jgi:outer membrane protein assembly factor BamA
MRKRIWQAAAISIFLASNLFGQTAHVLVIGDARISLPLSAYVRRLANLSKPSASIQDSAAAWLADRGYLDPQIDSRGDTLIVLMGELSTLRNIYSDADSSRSLAVLQPFSRENLKNALTTFTQRYQDSGYYFCRVQVVSARKFRNQIDIFVSVSPGPIVRIKNYQYEGLIRSDRRQIEKYLSAQSGVPLTDRVLARIESDASSIPYVDFLPPAVVRPLAGYSDVTIDLKFREREQFLFDGGAGYDPETKSGLVWNLNVKMQNLFGDGKDLSVQSARQDQGHNLLDFQYVQPSFLLGVGSVRAQLYTRDYRDQFYEFSASAGTSVDLSAQQSIGLDLTWKRVDPTAGPSYRRYAAEFSYELDQRDQKVNPGSGFRFKSRLGYAFRNYTADSSSSRGSFNDTRAQFEGEYYQKIAGSAGLFADLSYRGIQSKESPLPVSELYFVGGPGSLRGYRNEQFVAQRVVTGTLESRFHFPGGYLFGFYDGAYLNAPVALGSSVVIDQQYRFGFGIGLAVVDISRSVIVALGWNPNLNVDQPQLSIQFSSGL